MEWMGLRSYSCRLMTPATEKQHEREPTPRDAGELAGYCCRAPPTSYSPPGARSRLGWSGSGCFSNHEASFRTHSKADVLADKDPSFQPENFCRVIRASAWPG